MVSVSLLVTQHHAAPVSLRRQFGDRRATKCLHREPRSHQTAARRGRSAPAVVPTAFLTPNLLSWGKKDDDPSAHCSVDDVLAVHPKWRVGHELSPDETDTMWRKFKCRDDRAGHQLLEALQAALYETNEKGCRIRRETQGLYYMCCDGVRVRLNEPRHEVLVEVPMPAATREDVLECKQTLAQIEALAAVHSRGHRARG
uniref:Uncharacterized protein n=1 Tax=Mantoniella antarctica TaxID=81844 RepID=A0A7S0T1F8_9CHLO|mmetsp:Transcript_5742/g.14251  ORF Transcript_5742/g.14251 Transcript_5742/m.14251 type:complete len:200 (+) Transcript_5742:180-779(+)